jgi:ABC-2 type transport system permease protein
VKLWAIFKKELRIYFTTPLAYAILFVFLLVTGFFFYIYFSQFAMVSMQAAMNPQLGRDINLTEWVMRPLFTSFISIILLLSLVPMITMRLFAEERRSGTIELLLTYPVRDGGVLVAKFLAALALYGAMLVLTLLYPAMLRYFTPLEWGPLLTMYLGLVLMGATFLSIGLFFSSVTENQIVASLATFAMLLLLWSIGFAADSVGGATGKILQHLSVVDRFDSFSKGLLDTKDVIYFVNVTLLALFLTLRALEARRWKG